MAKNDKNKAQIFHFDLYGKREEKYDFLNENSLASVDWTALQPEAPNFFFVNKNMQGKEEYEKGFKVDELFNVFGMGITTGNDNKLVDFKKDELENKYGIENLKRVYYRLFDIRYINYDLKLVERGREKLMKNFINGNNLGLISLKGVRNNLTSKFGICNLIVDKSIISTLDNGYAFPLYLYPESSKQQSIEQTKRTPNLNMEIVQQIADKLGLAFTQEKENGTSTGLVSVFFSPIDILDYIYAVLHSPTYREKYKEFLKIDFPRVPYPKDADTFWKLVKLGEEIREIHLLENQIVGYYITQYPIDGDNVVISPKYVPISKDEETGVLQGNVYINETQYFANVPLIAWKFYIGGYQPAQKWLKDRKDRKLEFEDILHYQKIIVALTETDRLMKEIDKVEIV